MRDIEIGGGTAIVTGGSGGIGQAVVTALSGQGVRTAVLDPAATSAKGPSGGSSGGADLALDCDVRDAAAVQAAVARVEEELGPALHLVCAAGVVSEAPLAELDPAEFRRVVEVSLYGTFHAIRAVLPRMSARGRGGIVAMSTGWATKGYPNGAHYAAAKAGVEALVKSAALEVATLGVRVNALAPGPVETPMLTGFPDYHARAADRARAIPMGRVGQAGDIVGPTLFLLSDAAGYMTGQVVQVNGGLLMP
ncbi:SDR family oxidoreductase [Nonomuraea sp. K274]|uniref:SDR family oxidoreductase n=1 Tax=Nonomuraea cypriaca TaxID=1187855 RepID=A0A931AJ53_9ACTN|nr:SDR family NAD(P)-dependent oxidoreductase [Nonomuraea cypriaca]MBF8191949.1 SDR family oxidoreductase [Nonomuraea cypriaca]